jgi:hypothetical protein
MLKKALVMQLTELPIIKQVYRLYQISQFKKQMKDLDGWERFVKIKQQEKDDELFRFNVALFSLKTCLQDKTTTAKELESRKKEILDNPLIKLEEFEELKQWTEQAEIGETNFLVLEKAMNNLPQ